MTDFKELPSKSLNGGVQYLAKFDNGFGASIVRHDFSYGNESGLWELAVIKYDASGDYELTYDTHITDDVMGYLSEDDVNETLKKIEQL